MLQVEGVRRTYQPVKGLLRALTRTATDVPVEALRGIDFTVRRGRIVGLVGPNGAGKTTLIRIIAGLLDPDEGRVLVNGHDPSVDHTAAARAVGLVLADDRSLYWRLTGRQNLEFHGALYGLLARRGERPRRRGPRHRRPRRRDPPGLRLLDGHAGPAGHRPRPHRRPARPRPRRADAQPRSGGGPRHVRHAPQPRRRRSRRAAGVAPPRGARAHRRRHRRPDRRAHPVPRLAGGAARARRHDHDGAWSSCSTTTVSTERTGDRDRPRRPAPRLGDRAHLPDAPAPRHAGHGHASRPGSSTSASSSSTRRPWTATRGVTSTS